MEGQDKKRTGLATRHVYNYMNTSLDTVSHVFPFVYLPCLQPLRLSNARDAVGHPIYLHHHVGGNSSVKRRTNRISGVKKLTFSDSAEHFNLEASEIHCLRSAGGGSRQTRLADPSVKLQETSNKV